METKTATPAPSPRATQMLEILHRYTKASLYKSEDAKTLRGAHLVDAYLRDADLRGADLRDADLRGANLRGADLGGAYLRDAEIPSGVAATCLGSGDGTRYPWRAWLMRGGSLVLSLGCIERPLGWWRSAAGAKVCADEHGDAARLSALLTWVEALAAARRQGG